MRKQLYLPKMVLRSRIGRITKKRLQLTPEAKKVLNMSYTKTDSKWKTWQKWCIGGAIIMFIITTVCSLIPKANTPTDPFTKEPQPKVTEQPQTVGQPQNAAKMNATLLDVIMWIFPFIVIGPGIYYIWRAIRREWR